VLLWPCWLRCARPRHKNECIRLRAPFPNDGVKNQGDKDEWQDGVQEQLARNTDDIPLERELQFIPDRYCNLCGCELNECAMGTPAAPITLPGSPPFRMTCGSFQDFVNGWGERSFCLNPAAIDVVLEHCKCYNLSTGDPVTKEPTPIPTLQPSPSPSHFSDTPSISYMPSQSDFPSTADSSKEPSTDFSVQPSVSDSPSNQPPNDGGSWILTTEASPSSSDTTLGSALTMAGNMLVAGAPASIFGPKSGKVQPFQRQVFGQSFFEIPAFSAETGDQISEVFGASVDMIMDADGIPSLVVGDPRATGLVEGFIRFGVGFYFEYDAMNETWNPVGGSLRGDETLGEAGGVLAEAVSISQTSQGVKRIALGAPSSSEAKTFTLNTGRLYTYELTDGVWTRMTEEPELGPAGSYLGAALDFSTDGQSLAVGVPGSIPSESGPLQDGSVRVYDWNPHSSIWEQVAVENESGPDQASFGRTVKFIDHDKLAVGGPTFNSQSGMVRVYQRDATTGTFSPVGADLVGSSANQQVGAALCGNSGRFATASSNAGFAVYQFSEQAETWEVLGDTLLSPLQPGEPIVECALSEDGNTLALSDASQIAVYDYIS